MSHDKSLKRAVTLIGSCMPFSVLPMHYYSLQGRQDALRVAVLPPGQSAESERELIEYITRGLDSVLRDYPSAGVCIMGDFNQMKLSRLCRRFNLKTRASILGGDGGDASPPVF